MASRLVTRSQWDARPPRSVSHSIAPEGNTLHYAGPTPWTDSRAVGGRIDRSSPARFRDTTNHDSCPFIVRSSQDYHMDVRGFYDIGYTSLACPHGVRFEGRGKGVRPAAQGTNEGNRVSYGTQAMIGEGDPLTDECKRALLDEESRLGVPFRWGHRDWKSTACPGEPGYAWRKAGFPHPGGTPDEEDELMGAKEDIIDEMHKTARLLAGTLSFGKQNTVINDRTAPKVFTEGKSTKDAYDAAVRLDGGEGMPIVAAFRREVRNPDTGELGPIGREIAEIVREVLAEK